MLDAVHPNCSSTYSPPSSFRIRPQAAVSHNRGQPVDVDDVVYLRLCWNKHDQASLRGRVAADSLSIVSHSTAPSDGPAAASLMGRSMRGLTLLRQQRDRSKTWKIVASGCILLHLCGYCQVQGVSLTGLVREGGGGLAHVELAGDHVGDEARAVLAEELDLTAGAGDGATPHRAGVGGYAMSRLSSGCRLPALHRAGFRPGRCEYPRSLAQ